MHAARRIGCRISGRNAGTRLASRARMTQTFSAYVMAFGAMLFAAASAAALILTVSRLDPPEKTQA
jgi:hypothetical protein